MRLFIHTYLSLKQPFLFAIASLITLSLLLTSPLQAAQSNSNEKAQEKSRAKLSDVQKAIAKQESNIFDTNKQRSTLEKKLKNDDLAIAKVAKAINNLESSLKDTSAKIAELALSLIHI